MSFVSWIWQVAHTSLLHLVFRKKENANSFGVRFVTGIRSACSPPVLWLISKELYQNQFSFLFRRYWSVFCPTHWFLSLFEINCSPFIGDTGLVFIPRNQLFTPSAVTYFWPSAWLVNPSVAIYFCLRQSVKDLTFPRFSPFGLHWEGFSWFIVIFGTHQLFHFLYHMPKARSAFIKLIQHTTLLACVPCFVNTCACTASATSII